MKNKILAIVTAFLVAFSILSVGDIEAYAGTKLNNKKIYYISDYHSGDCVLSANVCMMRRAAILKGCNWKKIKNRSARKKLCYSFNGMKHDYVYHSGNLTFYGGHGYLPGGRTANKRKLKRLLKKHPEGIVVHGYDSYGPHGVLVTGCKKGVLYCADSTGNSLGRNVGITTFGNSSMASLSGCFQYWYIKSVVYDKYTAKYRSGLKKASTKPKVIYDTKLKSGVADKVTSKKFTREGYHQTGWYVTKYQKGKLHYLCKSKSGKIKWCKAKKIPSKYKKMVIKNGGKLKLKLKNGSNVYLYPKWVKNKEKIKPAKVDTARIEVVENQEIIETKGNNENQ